MGGRNTPEAIPILRAQSDLQELSLRHLAPSPPNGGVGTAGKLRTLDLARRLTL